MIGSLGGRILDLLIHTKKWNLYLHLHIQYLLILIFLVHLFSFHYSLWERNLWYILFLFLGINNNFIIGIRCRLNSFVSVSKVNSTLFLYLKEISVTLGS